MDCDDKSIVLPGDKLCSYEEYIPSDWTYVEDGYIKASIYGVVVVDNVNKTISVRNNNVPNHISKNDIIIGYVSEVRQQKILVTIKQINGQDRDLVAEYKGYVHISKASGDYVSSMHELYKIGDIICARVVTLLGYDYVELATNEDELGTIKAMCTNCRKFMKYYDNHRLICECGKVDSRKISNKYGDIR
ncbi:MAG: exosome complex RNA-binding protein Csl4 [Methanosphaera sp.]|nr:exosome complex RNA-binding protein Csl4 [Methanosphaera sp.]